MLSTKSESKLLGVKPQLVEVVRLAASNSPFPILCIEGVRTKERQAALYAQGRTAPGNKVTWTLESKHLTGDAVDLVPLIDGAIPWNDLMSFIVIGDLMNDAAKELGVSIRWGLDWDGDGITQKKGETDAPHFELT